MIKKTLIFFAFVLLLASCKENDTALDPNNQFHSSELLTGRLINTERAKLGLAELVYDENIAAIARSHSDAMASGAVPFSHDGFDGRVAQIQKLYTTITVGENVAYNSGAASPEQQAVGDWMESPGHRANIVGDYNRTGIGIAKSASGRYYFTQLFAKVKTTSIFF